MNTQAIKSIMAHQLKLKAEMIDDGLTMQDVESWDSLSHLNLILALEEESNIRFPMSVIPDLTSYKAICDAVKSLEK